MLPRRGVVEAGCWMLDAGDWMLDAATPRRGGCWMLDAGCWMLDAGDWMLDAGCCHAEGDWMLDTGWRQPSADGGGWWLPAEGLRRLFKIVFSGKDAKL